MTRPRILFVAQLEPFPAPLYGGQLRIDRLLRQLQQQFEVVFAVTSPLSEREIAERWPAAGSVRAIVSGPRDSESATGDPLWGELWGTVRAAVPRERPAHVRYRWSSALVARMQAAIAAHRIDAVWGSRIESAEMARAAGASRILVDVDDLEGEKLREAIHLRGSYKRRLLHRLQASALSQYERSLPARFGATVVTKVEDLAKLSAAGGGGRFVVPNGIDIPRDTPALIDEPTMLFVGALNYEPNLRAMEWLLQRVLPLIRAEIPAVRLMLAGRGAVDAEWRAVLEGQPVDLHVSPESMDPLYARAALCVAPLQTGGGTSIKVLEALAYGRALVATPIATRGLDVAHDTHLLVACDPAEFARAAVRMLRDRPARERLGRQGRALVVERYSWDNAGVMARDAMASLLR